MIRQAYASGRIVDLVLLIVVTEFAVLAWLCRRDGPAAILDRLFALAPGAALLLALRAALSGAGWIWVALWLTLSAPLHAVDLVRRGAVRRRKAGAP